MKVAILNTPSAALEKCELTYIERTPIHLEAAERQHARYAAALRRAGVQVELRQVNQTSPDAVFVEDTVIVLDELAVMTSMGNSVRRAEVAAMTEVIRGFRREVRQIPLPATIEGGDVLRIGRRLFVGETCRTNAAGIAALEAIVTPFGYQVIPVKVTGCLHLKTCITALNDETLLRNPDWLDSSPFSGFKLMNVAPGEPWAANVLRAGSRLIVSGAFPRTAGLIDSLGFENERADIAEFGKAEAGLTCMSLIFERE